MTHYAIVRRDLPLGMVGAALVHAAGESSDRLPSRTNAVVLEVPGEEELVALATGLASRGIGHVVIRESDPPYTGQAMAIGLEPVRDRTEVRRVLSHLPLLK